MSDTVLYPTAQLLPTLRTLSDRASTDGDLTFLLPSGETIHTYTFLFTPGSLDTFSTLADDGVRHISAEHVAAFQEARGHKRVCQALNQHYHNPASGDFLINNHRVHRAFIAARIPYFDALFRGRFSDSERDGAELDTGIVTPYALGALLWWCYIPVLPLNARIPYGTTASPEVIGNLLDLALAADYLRMDGLEKLVHGALLAACMDGGAAQMVLKGVVGWEAGEVNKRIRKTYQAAVSAVARNIKTWKRTLVELPDEVIQEIIEAVDLTTKIKSWKETRRLQEKVEGSRSKEKERWSEVVFKPLQSKIARAIADDMGNGNLRKLWATQIVDQRDLMALADFAVDVMDEHCCLSVWQGIRKWNKRESEGTKEKCIRWFRRRWFDLAMQGEFKRWQESGFNQEVNELAAALDITLEDLIPKEEKRRRARDVP